MADARSASPRSLFLGGSQGLAEKIDELALTAV